MEKIKVKVSKRSDVHMNLFGVDVVVHPVISVLEQKKILLSTLQSMFKDGLDGVWDEYLFELSLRYNILNTKTNIDFSEMEDEEADEILWGEFYEKISSSIINYDDVSKSILWHLTNEIQRYETRNSIGGILNSLIEKIIPIIKEFENMSPEKLSDLNNMANEMIEKINKSQVSKIITDIEGNKKRKIKTK